MRSLVHRYYHCAKNSLLGLTGCTGVTIPVSLLDDAVMTAIAERVLTPAHLSSLLQKLCDLDAKREGERDAALPALKAREAASDKALKGLYATARAVPEATDEKNYQES